MEIEQGTIVKVSDLKVDTTNIIIATIDIIKYLIVDKVDTLAKLNVGKILLPY